jgi:DNA-binding beta-propeller fold protein YncE
MRNHRRLGIRSLLAAAILLLLPGPASSQVLYAASFANDFVLVANGLTGAPIRQIGPGGPGNLNGPHDMVQTPEGVLLVANGMSNSVKRFDPGSGQFLGDLVASGAGGLINPTGMVIAGNQLLVASAGNHRVNRYDRNTGAFIGSMTGGGLTTPVGVALGPDGLLYVASASTDQILRFNLNTATFLDTFSSSGMSLPQGLAFGPNGDLFVTNFGSDNVTRLNGATGASLGVFGSTGTSGLNNPYGLAFGFDGHLYVAGLGNTTIKRFDRVSGTYLGDFLSINQPSNLLFAVPEPGAVTGVVGVALGAGWMFLRRRRGTTR